MDAEVRYVAHEGVHVAYTVVDGEGPPYLFVPDWYTNIEMWSQLPVVADFMRRLPTFVRFATYDQPGTGLSDDLPPDADLGMGTWTSVLGAILDELGWDRAHLAGFDTSAMVACTYAIENPERVSSLVLLNPTANLGAHLPPDQREVLADAFAKVYGTPEYIQWLSPSAAGDPDVGRQWARWQRQAARPAIVRRISRALFDLDARNALEHITCPVLVIHTRENRVITVDQGRYVAAHIPEAKLVEFDGADHFPIAPEDIERWITEIRRFVAGDAQAVQLNRVLATVLFTDIVSSTALTAAKGDERWRELLDRHDELSRQTIGRYGGRVIKSTGDGVLATLDSPARAVRCAQALRDSVRSLGIEIRAGLHTGEIELRGEDIGGTAVNIARRVCDAAAAGEVRVSETVTQVVAGSGLQFEHLGPHELKGVPGPWALYRARD